MSNNDGTPQNFSKEIPFGEGSIEDAIHGHDCDRDLVSSEEASDVARVAGSYGGVVEDILPLSKWLKRVSEKLLPFLFNVPGIKDNWARRIV